MDEVRIDTKIYPLDATVVKSSDAQLMDLRSRLEGTLSPIGVIVHHKYGTLIVDRGGYNVLYPNLFPGYAGTGAQTAARMVEACRLRNFPEAYDMIQYAKERVAFGNTTPQ